MSSLRDKITTAQALVALRGEKYVLKQQKMGFLIKTFLKMMTVIDILGTARSLDLLPWDYFLWGDQKDQDFKRRA